jgi:superfamily II DNA/RNA helicase
MINFCLPDDPEQYIHRSGRVGRADRMGLAVSMVAAPGARERVWFLQKSSGKLARANLPGNTKDYDTGGNCVWMDEAALLRAGEARLQKGGAQTLVPAAPSSASSSASSSSSSSSSSSAAAASSSSSSAAVAAGESSERKIIPRILPVALVSISGSARALPEVTAELAALPGRTALVAAGDAGSSAPALTSGTGRLMMHAMRLPDGVGGDETVYGESKMEETGSAEGAARLLALQPTVITLALLEKDAQASYLQLRARFGAAALTGGAGAASSM